MITGGDPNNDTARPNCPNCTAYRSFSSSSSRKEVVKVPQMAESITEGTLKQWNKKAGDFVQADEEVATIETDKVSHDRTPGIFTLVHSCGFALSPTVSTTSYCC